MVVPPYISGCQEVFWIGVPKKNSGMNLIPACLRHLSVPQTRGHEATDAKSSFDARLSTGEETSPLSQDQAPWEVGTANVFLVMTHSTDEEMKESCGEGVPRDMVV